MKKAFYILSFLVHLFPYLNAQESISVKSISITSQMPSNSVPRVFQDKEGFMWFGTLDGLCRYDGYQVLVFRSDSNNSNLLTNNEITCIAEDSTSHLWIGTKKGINILNKATYKIKHLDSEELHGQEIRDIHVTPDGDIWVGTINRLYRYNPDFSLRKDYKELLVLNAINDIYEDKENNLWVMIWENGLFRYNPEQDNFTKFPKIGNGDNPFKMYQDHKNNYWIGTWGDGLYRFDPHKEGSEKYTPYKIVNHERNLDENCFFGIIQDNKYEYLWLMSTSGLYTLKYSPEKDVENVDISHLFTESNNIYSDIIKDNAGNLWIGTFSEGVFTINFDQTPIKNYPIRSIKKEIGITTNITVLYEDIDGDIWINQNRWGFGIYNPENDKVRFYLDYPALKNIGGIRFISCISSFKADPGNVWVGLENEPVIYRLKKERDDITIQEKISLNNLVKNSGRPRKFYEDRNSNIWIVTSNGLLLKHHNQNMIIPISFSLGEITDITEDTRGNIWVTSKKSGIYEVPIGNNQKINESSIINYTNENSSLKSNNIGAIYGDAKGQLWIGTKEGSIIKYDIVTGKFEDVSSVFDMIDENILNIVSDDYGHIWISTNKRIVEFNPQNNAIKEYVGTDDDILVNSFLVNSLCKNHKGQILYGGNRGISVFTSSEKLSEEIKAYNVFITDVKINNQSVFKDNDNRWFDLSNLSLEFEPENKNIEINFSCLNYSDPQKIRYAYKLDGVDDDWIYTGSRQFAVYNQLEKGTYTFNVKATDENGLWSEHVTTLRIYKRPAFYETWWAYIIYMILFMCCVYWIYRIVRNRVRLRQELKIAQIEKEKSEEVTQTKLRYFTNISHDFLTPLTILSCLIDDIEITYKGKITQFDSMRSTISRLRRLLQQVLDFRKVESGNMKLKISNGDIVMFIRDVCYTNFFPLMKKKNIEFTFNSSPLHIQAWFDADKIDKIIFNLLSNAFKYTPVNGKVSLNINEYTIEEHSYITIKIKDTGIGMSKEDTDRIFTRFYSNKINDAGKSNGIGLNLTKDLVELHHGTIQVESKIGEGTLFTIDIPVNKEFHDSENLDQTVIILDENTDIFLSESSLQENISDISSEKKVNKKNLTHILIVEDNEELLFIMENILSRQYNISTSANGKEALSLIRKNNIDVVISDVMMPEMDGLELCRILKTNIETSHIPVILLTAKNSAEDRIECYNAGADGYISKPFELKVLEARINNFISTKKARQQEFQSNKEINIETLEYPSIDEKFLMNTLEIIETHLSDSEFDVNMLAQALHLSKSTLYRKLKTMTGLSPVEFIRNIRLKHACKKLKDPSISISEVAYSVGFSDPKYFANCFKAEFGITPSEYQKK